MTEREKAEKPGNRNHSRDGQENQRQERQGQENQKRKKQRQDREKLADKSLSAYLSVWALLARGSFYKILLVLALMLLAECVLFYRTLRGGSMAEGFAGILRESCTYPVFLAALGLTFLILVRLEGMLDSRSKCTLLRLNISRMSFFVIETVYNVFCLTVLFALQIGAAFWMIWLYGGIVETKYPGNQLLFFTFYRNDFLHCLLPMADTGKWVRNALLLLALGMSAACGIEVEKRKYVIPVSLYAVAVCSFASPMGMDGMGRNPLDLWCGGLSSLAIEVILWDAVRRYRRKRQEAAEYM